MGRKAIRLNPHYPEYWTLELGPIFFDAHQYPEAITTLESCACWTRLAFTFTSRRIMPPWAM